MDRLLLVLNDPLEIRRDAQLRAVSTSEADEIALCLVVAPSEPQVNHLRLQQRMAGELRALLGEAAERIATFVVSGEDGDDVASCAAAWGASRVIDLRRGA